jgi:hypothetical protein
LICVQPLDARLVSRYEAFIRADPTTLFYHGTAFRSLVGELLEADERTLVALEDDRLVGALPLLSLDGERGRVFNSLPYYGSNGGVVAASAEAHDALAAAYAKLVSDPGTLAATVVPNPFAPRGDELQHNLIDERIAQFTPIASAQDELLRRIDATARRNVAKARRTGYRVAREHEALPELHRLHDTNIRAIGGRPKTRRFFDLVAERLVPGEDYDLWTARTDRDVAAALLVFYWGRFVEYYTPAVAHDHRSSQPLSLVLLEAILDAGRRGFSFWNWGGTWTSQKPLYRFKRKWGADERPYSYLVQLNDPTLFDVARSTILAAYPDFYVLPFDLLKEPSSPSS